MSALSVEVPFPVFYDRSGEPLENGYVWIGQANLNPQTNPIQVYFDRNLTQPAAQPLRTLAGYIANAGTPAQIYVDAENYSILVQDKNGTMVYNFPDGTGASQEQEVIYPSDFGAIGNGLVDDTLALTEFFAAIAGTNKQIGDIGDDQVYLFSQLVIPNDVAIRGKSIFRSDASLSGSSATVTVQGSFRAETLHITSSGLETNANILLFEGDDVSIQNLIVKSDTQRAGTGGVVCYGSNYDIDYFESVFIARPIQFQKPAIGLGAQTNIRLGTVDIYSYIRGIGMTNCNNWSIEFANMRVADSRAAKTPGHNGILIQACQDFTIGDMYVADTGEHAFRIGGNNNFGSDTARFSVNSITTRRTGGCAVKVSPVPDTCYDGSFGIITAIDTGRGATTANNEPIRFTNANNIYVGSLVALSNEFANSCHRVAILNSDTNITIDSIHAENVSGRVINIDEIYDTGTGNFSGLYVNACFATMTGARNAFEINYSTGGRTIGNVYIRNVNVSGYTNFVYENDFAITTTGVIFISGVASIPAFDSVTPITVDITSSVDGTRYVGSSANRDSSAPFTVGAVSAFDTGVTPSSKAAFFVAAGSTSTAGDGNIGASLAFGRAGSNRRGAAIVSKQFGANAFNVGISFLPSASASTTNEAVAERMYLKPTGTLLLPSLSTYANNAAALGGGLVVGDVYQTATGEVRIVV